MYKMRRKIRTRRILRRRGSTHVVVWLIGLAILAVTDWWWPGILILVVFSILLEANGKRRDQGEIDEEQPEPIVEERPKVAPPPPPRVETVTPPKPVPPAEYHKAEWLPLSCPKCGAPTRAADVRWTGDAIAACPFCGSNLPLNRS